MGWTSWAAAFDFFRWRGWLPVPLYAAALCFADFERWHPLQANLGAVLTLFGVGMRALARCELGRSSDTRRLHCQRLATEGIYAWTRNPIYLGNIAIACGLALLAGTGVVAALLGVLLALHYAQVVHMEERHLAAAFPVRYAAYRREVSRFLPRQIPPAVCTRLTRVGRELRIWAWIGAAIAALAVLRHF